MTDIAVLGLGW